ncbi:MAG TPA: hypothetical protein VK922_01320 [Gemmatimonadaceae bacterium]|nr:hypothetical protein [Gemmatimonadaceae bacterium]
MRLVCILAALLIALGCGTAEQAPPDTTDIMAGAGAGTSERAVTAARIADAIARTPNATDSILSAAGHTTESFERLMYEIAADSAAAAAYAAARAPR